MFANLAYLLSTPTPVKTLPKMWGHRIFPAFRREILPIDRMQYRSTCIVKQILSSGGRNLLAFCARLCKYESGKPTPQNQALIHWVNLLLAERFIQVPTLKAFGDGVFFGHLIEVLAGASVLNRTKLKMPARSEVLVSGYRVFI